MESLTQFMLAVPGEEVVKHFKAQARGAIAEIRVNDDESHALAALCDTLLPKLMSSELRVRAAERILAEAGA